MSTTRPDDDEVPRAVRALFATNRLQGAWGLLTAETPEMRSAAFEGVTRILEKNGLTITDVLTTVLAAPATPSVFAGLESFTDLFSTPASRATTGRAEPSRREPPRRSPVILQGADIPSFVEGSITVVQERPTRRAGGRMLVFSVTAPEATFAPLVAFDDEDIDRLKECANNRSTASMRVRPSTKDRHMPSATGVRTA